MPASDRLSDVLIFSHEYPPFQGGVGEVAFNLFTHLPMAQKRVLTTRYIGTNLVYGDDPPGITRFETTRGGWREYLAGVRALHRVLRETPRTLVIAVDPFAQRCCWILSAVRSLRYANICHGSEVLWNHKPRALLGDFSGVYRRSITNVAVSAFTRSLLADRGAPNLPEGFTLGVREHYFEEAVDPDRTEALRRELDLHASFVFVSLSRLDRRKGHDVIVDAMAALRTRTQRPFRWIVCGDGVEAEALRDQVRRAALQDIVSFRGSVSEEEKIAFLDLADVFVLASRQVGETVEGLGLTYVEAQARRCAVIGGNHGGVPEAIIDGKTGLLADPESPEAVADALEHMMDDALRTRLGVAGHAHAAATFRWHRSAETLAALLREAEAA